MTAEEQDELWEVMRPYCDERGITREAFEMVTRIIEACDTSEKVENLVQLLRGPIE